MTPEAAASLLRGYAQAVLAGGTDVDIDVRITAVGAVGASVEPLSPGARQARRRARVGIGPEAYADPRDVSVTRRGDLAVPPPHTPPASQEGSGLEKELPESQTNPEEQKSLPITACAREVALVAARDANVTTASIEPRADGIHKTAPKKRRAGLWHFVPDDWQPKERHKTLALGLVLDVNAEAEKFRAHEFDRPKSDPDRAFDGWLRRAMDWGRRGANRPASEQQRLLERSKGIIDAERARMNGGHPR